MRTVMGTRISARKLHEADRMPGERMQVPKIARSAACFVLLIELLLTVRLGNGRCGWLCLQRDRLARCRGATQA